MEWVLGVQRGGAVTVGYTAITKCYDRRCHRHKGGALEASPWKSLLCLRGPLAFPRCIHLPGVPLYSAFLGSCLQACLTHLTILFT